MNDENLECGDILHFSQYFFTDAGTTKGNRFALLLLPARLTSYDNSCFCCVITSQTPYGHRHLVLRPEGYSCLSKESYACFDRRDYQSYSDLSNSDQPRDSLCGEDLKSGLKVLSRVLHTDPKADVFLRGTVIREWKKRLGK